MDPVRFCTQSKEMISKDHHIMNYISIINLLVMDGLHEHSQHLTDFQNE